MNQLISVIIPIYKVEDYLSRCLDSILNQTYRNLEIILVDDGSPDACPELCDEYAAKDSRVKVIHKSNGGLSDARNAGMKIATGDYISFIDSDDWVSHEFYEVLLENAIKQKSDIIECSVIRAYDSSAQYPSEEDGRCRDFGTEDALKELITERNFRQHVWNKLYKRDIVDVLFPIQKLNEDEYWTYQVFGNARIVTRINKTMYFYFQRGDSIMGQTFNLRRLDMIEALSERQKYIDKEFPSIASIAKMSYLGSCMYAYQCCLKYLSKAELEVARERISEILSECRLDKNLLKELPWKRRMWFSFANSRFYLCCKVRNLLGIGF